MSLRLDQCLNASNYTEINCNNVAKRLISLTFIKNDLHLKSQAERDDVLSKLSKLFNEIDDKIFDLLCNENSSLSTYLKLPLFDKHKENLEKLAGIIQDVSKKTKFAKSIGIEVAKISAIDPKKTIITNVITTIDLYLEAAKKLESSNKIEFLKLKEEFASKFDNLFKYEFSKLILSETINRKLANLSIVDLSSLLDMAMFIENKEVRSLIFNNIFDYINPYAIEHWGVNIVKNFKGIYSGFSEAQSRKIYSATSDILQLLDKSILEKIFSNSEVIEEFNLISNEINKSFASVLSGLLFNVMSEDKKSVIVKGLLRNQNLKCLNQLTNVWVKNLIYKFNSDVFAETLIPQHLTKELNILKYRMNEQTIFSMTGEILNLFQKFIPYRTIQTNLFIFTRIFPLLNPLEIKEFLKRNSIDWSLVFENNMVFNLLLLNVSANPIFRIIMMKEYYYSHSVNKLKGEILSYQSKVFQDPNQNLYNFKNDTVNVNYWYDDEDVSSVLNNILESIGGVDYDGCNITALSPVSIENIHQLKKILIDRFSEDGIKSGRNNANPHKYLIPLNKNQNHWVGLMLNVNPKDKTVKFIYIDPMGHSNENLQINNGMTQLLQGVMPEDYKVESDNETLNKHKVWRQPDLSSCGPYTIANLIRYATGDDLDSDNPGAESIRQLHIDLLGDKLLNKQSGNVNVSNLNTFQYSYVKVQEDKASFNSVGEKLYASIGKLSYESKSDLYQLCSKAESSGNIYSETRNTLKDIFELELALCDGNADIVKSKMCEIFKLIFKNVTDGMSIESLFEFLDENNPKSLFSDDLPNKLQIVADKEQANLKSSSRL